MGIEAEPLEGEQKTGEITLGGDEAVEAGVPAENIFERQTKLFTVEVRTEGKTTPENSGRKNEDATFSNPQKRTFGLFDGAGGAANGEVASSTARDVISTKLESATPGTTEEAIELLKGALVEADQAIRTKQVELGNVGNDRMLTTAVVAKILAQPDGRYRAVVANVGDSTAYIRRANGKLEQVSVTDDILSSLKQEDVKAIGSSETLEGFRSRIANARVASDLHSEHEKIFFNCRNQIVAALGQEIPVTREMVHVSVVDLEPGDELLLLSDGVTDNLTESEMAQSKDLVGDSIARSKEPKPENPGPGDNIRSKNDDITAIRVKLEKQPATAKEDLDAAVVAAADPTPSTIDRLAEEDSDREAEEDIKESDAELAVIASRLATAEKIETRRDLLNQEILVRTAKLARLEALKKSGALAAKFGSAYAESYEHDAVVEKNAIDAAANKINALDSEKFPKQNVATATTESAQEKKAGAGKGFFAGLKAKTSNFFGRLLGRPSVSSERGRAGFVASIGELARRRGAEANPQSVVTIVKKKVEGPSSVPETPPVITPPAPEVVSEAPAKVERKFEISANEAAAIDFSEDLDKIMTKDSSDSWNVDTLEKALTDKLDVAQFGDRTDKVEIARVMNRIMFQAAQDPRSSAAARRALAEILERRGFVKVETLGPDKLRMKRLEDRSQAIKDIRA